MKKIIALMLCGVLVGCNVFMNPADRKFFDFLEKTYVKQMENNYADGHFAIVHPEKIGLHYKSYGFGELVTSQDDYKKQLEEMSAYEGGLSDTAHTYFVVLTNDLKAKIELTDKKYEYMRNVLDPSDNVTDDMKDEFLEFQFYNEDDIKNYISMCKDTPRYLGEVIDYITKQEARGLFMDDVTASSYLETLTHFTDQNDNPLTDYFDTYNFSFKLTETKKAQYHEALEDVYKEDVYTSFVKLRNTVKKLMGGTNASKKGLYSYHNGPDYFEEKLHTKLGTSMTPDDIWTLMKERADLLRKRMDRLEKENPEVSEYNDVDLNRKTYKELVDFLRKETKKHFPIVQDVDYEVLPMTENNTQTSSAAYFVVPPVDTDEKNIIRVNTTGMKKDDINSLDTYNTLAHEGFPGHLYQYAYMKQLNRPYILDDLDCDGYSEGYATYVQYLAYTWVDHDQEIVRYQKYNDELGYILLVLCDIGIHARGYSKNECEKLYKEYRVDTADINDQYYQLIGSPGIFESYYVGCVLIEHMKNNAKKKLGDKFDEVKFHTAVLENGTVRLDQLERQVKAYIKENA